ncbi:hypothetical protein [Nonomuraea sp. B1E8]|uniref:hypothetical protein n=1 Tax=unclassified Nonomuraea TaxID=2593643 RepID=UPI00325E1C3B
MDGPGTSLNRAQAGGAPDLARTLDEEAPPVAVEGGPVAPAFDLPMPGVSPIEPTP